MANTKVSNLTAITTLATTDLAYIARSPFAADSDSKKITIANFAPGVIDLWSTLLTAKTSLADADIFALDQSPFGAGDARKITALNLSAAVFARINSLTTKTTIVDTDEFPLQQSPFGATDGRQVTALNLAAYLLASGSFVIASSSYYTIVGGATTDTLNGTALVNAYAAAKLKTPGGNALSTSNRHTIILLPGRYSVTDGAFVMDTQFIDLVGLSTNTGALVYTGSGPTVFGDTIITSNGHTVGLTANDVTLANLALLTSSTSKFALNVTTSNGSQFWRNLLIWNTSNVANPCMNPSLGFAGQYEDVRAWNESSFGNSNTTDASGKFYRCKAGSFSFGTAISSGSTASGFFYDCEADGASFGTNGTASGTFIRCKYVPTEASASAMFGGAGTASGYFEDCVANGVDGSFGNTASGTFVRCRSSRATGGTAAAGGAFGSGTTGVASGLFMYCEAGNTSFGSGGATGKTASGTFNYCKAGTNSFGGGGTNAGTMSGTMLWCSMIGFLNASVTGKIAHMRIEATGTDQAAVLVNGAKLYDCTLIATGTGNSVDSSTGGAVNATMAHCRMNKGINSNVTNLIATPYIVNDVAVV